MDFVAVNGLSGGQSFVVACSTFPHGMTFRFTAWLEADLDIRATRY